MNETNWIQQLAQKASRRLNKEAAREDLTLQPLTQLLQDGNYQIVIWDSGRARCFKCTDLAGQQWTLEQFLSGLQHSAPIAEKSHPNCNCTIIIQGQSVPNIRMDYNGNYNEE